MSEGAYRRSVAKCLQACNERLARRRCRHSLAVARLIAQKKKGFRGCGTPSWFLIELHEPNSVVGATPKACSVSPLAPSPPAPACNVRRRFRRSLRYSLGSFPGFAEEPAPAAGSPAAGAGATTRNSRALLPRYPESSPLRYTRAPWRFMDASSGFTRSKDTRWIPLT